MVVVVRVVAVTAAETEVVVRAAVREEVVGAAVKEEVATAMATAMEGTTVARLAAETAAETEATVRAAVGKVAEEMVTEMMVAAVRMASGAGTAARGDTMVWGRRAAVTATAARVAALGRPAVRSPAPPRPRPP